MPLSCRRRAVIEDVPQMTAATAAVDFGPCHEELAVFANCNRIGQGIPEAGPAGAAFEFGFGRI